MMQLTINYSIQELVNSGNIDAIGISAGII